MLVIGLGNPGPEYSKTRHNAGFMLVDSMAGVKRPKKICRGEFYSSAGKLSGFFKPMTYMNLSGKAVKCLVERMSIPLTELVVCHDDMDIPLGEIKVKFGGGAGGHKGILSVSSELGSSDFARIRIGISKPASGDPADYVLEPFSEEEKDIFDKGLKQAVSAVHALAAKGVPTAQTIFNRKLKSETSQEIDTNV